MSKELVISSNSHETRVAILEDDQLVEIYFQRANEYSLAGSIHKGRVTRVLPGMQSAFVDLGLERDTFLYVSDFFEENGEEFDRIEVKPSRQSTQPPQRSEAIPALIEPADEIVAIEDEATDTLEIASVSSPAEEPRTEAVGANAGSQERDRQRGRRGRRRRTRGKGFPDSKYASDLTSEPAEEAPEDQTKIDSREPDDEPSDREEVFLLPGESLAKYRGRPVESDASDTKDEEDEAPSLSSADIVEAKLGEERFEAAEVDLVEEVEEEEAPAAEALPAVAEPIPVETAAQEESSSSPVDFSSPFPDPGFFAPPVTTPFSVVAPEPAEVATAAVTEAEEIQQPVESIEVSEEAVQEEAVQAEEDDDQPGPDVDDKEHPIEEPPAEDGEQAPVEEPPAEAPLQASVREQDNRYQHRSSRRMRRRGRGGDRGGDRGADRGGDRGTELRGVEKTAEHRPADRVAGGHRPNERHGEQREVRAAQPEADDRKSPLPSISDLLKEGQEIIVQIAKEPLGQKGARITSHIALPGRYVVYMPTVEHMGVSRKIASDEERQRLKRILQAHRQGITGGFIVRTAGEGHTEDEIAADMAYLYNLWLDIRQKSEKKPSPLLLHHDLEIVQRILRDQLSDMYKNIWVDNEDVYESTVRFMQRFQPALVNRVKMYTRSAPIFDAFGITNEIEKALRPKVWLKSGGYIVINQTEALVAIDVNTGKYVGKSNRLEDTITKTNTEAVKEIVRQVRLRDLGGIIVVDFIDMDERKNRQKVMQALEEAMRADRAPYKILQFNDFGLVAITRKRVKQSLERSLCTPCPTCEGAGYTKSVTTVVGEILQEAVKLRPSMDGKNVVLRTHPDVAKFLKSNTNDFLEELESIAGRSVMVKSDPLLHPEKFDLAV